MLEAGGWDRDPWIHIPLGWGRMLIKRMHDWMYFSEPEPGMNGRRIECARGKVIGGSSSINAMAYVRGHRGDYDRWAASGLGQWSYAHVLPYFRRQESWAGGANEYRGNDGPLTTQPTRFADPLVEAYASRRRRRRIFLDRRLQWPRAARLQPLADDDPRWPPLQRRGRLSEAGHGPAPICASRSARW